MTAKTSKLGKIESEFQNYHYISNQDARSLLSHDMKGRRGHACTITFGEAWIPSSGCGLRGEGLSFSEISAWKSSPSSCISRP
jgi:hypothetical protein